MSDLLHEAVDFVRDLPLLIKFLVLTFSVGIEYIFPVFPGDTIVLLAGFLKARGALDLLEICLSIVIGTIFGSLLAYKLGQLIATKRFKYRWIKYLTSSESFEKFNAWYQRWGTIFLLLNRFFPGIRALFFVAAGAAKLPIAKVLILGALSAILFNGCLLIFGYLVGYNVELILRYLYQYSTTVYLLMGFFLGLFFVYWWQKKRRQ